MRADTLDRSSYDIDDIGNNWDNIKLYQRDYVCTNITKQTKRFDQIKLLIMWPVDVTAANDHLSAYIKYLMVYCRFCGICTKPMLKCQFR